MSNTLCILVSRPDPGGVELCQQIQSQGDIAIHLPTIAFAPPPDQAAFEQGIKKIGEQDWLIFVSPQAVRASVPAIRRAWPIMPDTVKLAAVGSGTAKALAEAGYLAACVPEQEDSEGLLAMPPFQNVTNERIMIIRGQGGRELFEKALPERGAKITSLIAYQRTLPSIDISPYLLLIKDGKIDIVICTSYESVANLKQLAGEAGWPALKQTPLIVVSDRIKLLAEQAGFQTIWVANNASHQAILAVIAQKREGLCQSR